MQLTCNTQAFLEAEQYSQFILTNLHDGLLGEAFYRNVSDFQSGTTLNIKTIGTVTLQEAAEDVPVVYNPIDTGNVTLTITEGRGDAWYVTDELREDGSQVDRLMAARAVESTRAFQEEFETTFLRTAAEYFAQGNPGYGSPNLINGQPHVIPSTEADGTFQKRQVILARLAMDKANVPAEGRVLIVDPVVEATLNNLVTITHDVTAFGREILENGFARGQRYMMSLYGFDVIVSNRLHVDTYSDGTTTIENGIGNVAMSIADDNTKPIMAAIRRTPRVEGERNKDRARDEFVVRSRYGMGIQRLDTLVILPTSATVDL